MAILARHDAGMNAEHPVIQQVLSLRRQYVGPIAVCQRVELAAEAVLRTPPQVLLLGNHSSGKSSLINHLLARKVQRTGVAPVDDGFTVLMHGEREHSLDGATVTTNPGLPFHELSRFGPGLVQHLQGRTVDADLLRYVWLVDSPGMIDSARPEAKRPYDFNGVVRWFAQRADLVVLFFDPEKPGTTGETLAVLTEALVGMDNKLRIVMNKMDLFEGIRDFARTYGALCWNLSRCLPTKDMPHIYTTVIPELVREHPEIPLEGFAAALLELEAAIAELPERRVDTVITRVIEEARQLFIRTAVAEHLRRDVRRTIGLVLVGCLAATAAAGGLAWWAFQTFGWAWGALAAGLLILGLALCRWLPALAGRMHERAGVANLDGLFRAVFHDELVQRERTEDLLHDWQVISDDLAHRIESLGLRGLAKVAAGRLRRLRQVYELDLPALRRL